MRRPCLTEHRFDSRRFNICSRRRVQWTCREIRVSLFSVFFFFFCLFVFFFPFSEMFFLFFVWFHGSSRVPRNGWKWVAKCIDFPHYLRAGIQTGVEFDPLRNNNNPSDRIDQRCRIPLARRLGEKSWINTGIIPSKCTDSELNLQASHALLNCILVNSGKRSVSRETTSSPVWIHPLNFCFKIHNE